MNSRHTKLTSLLKATFRTTEVVVVHLFSYAYGVYTDVILRLANVKKAYCVCWGQYGLMAQGVNAFHLHLFVQP